MHSFLMRQLPTLPSMSFNQPVIGSLVPLCAGQETWPRKQDVTSKRAPTTFAKPMAAKIDAWSWLVPQRVAAAG